MSRKTNVGEIKRMEASIRRSWRIAFAAALVSALVVPIEESSFANTATGQLITFAISTVTLVIAALALGSAFILDRRLQRKINSK